MENYEKYIVIGMFVLFGISLVMPYAESKKTCDNLGLLYESVYSNCVDEEGNHWSYYWHPNEVFGVDWYFTRDYCAVKCIDNLCTAEYGEVCELQ